MNARTIALGITVVVLVVAAVLVIQGSIGLGQVGSGIAIAGLILAIALGAIWFEFRRRKKLRR